MWQTAAHKFQKFENNNKYFSRADRNYFKSPAARHLSLGQAKRLLVVSSASQAGTGLALPAFAVPRVRASALTSTKLGTYHRLSSNGRRAVQDLRRPLYFVLDRGTPPNHKADRLIILDAGVGTIAILPCCCCCCAVVVTVAIFALSRGKTVLLSL